MVLDSFMKTLTVITIIMKIFLTMIGMSPMKIMILLTGNHGVTIQSLAKIPEVIPGLRPEVIMTPKSLWRINPDQVMLILDKYKIFFHVSGGITADKIPTNVKCTTKYKTPPAKVMQRLAAKKPRIVGGDKVDLNTWGWYARLNIGDGGLCGATIIGQRWLLTASHCTVEQDGKTAVKPSDVTAYLNDYAANQKDKFERKITIKKVYNHPSYHSTSNGAPRNDITLLETNEDLFGDNIKGNAAPACLPAKGSTDRS